MTVMNCGASSEASVLARAHLASRTHLVNTATFSKDRAYEELYDVWKDCNARGWDGGDAVPVEQQTYHNAWRVIEALPLGYPLPSVGAEPDGHLTLEWHGDTRWILSVSVAPEGTLHYAALFGADDPRGSCPFFGEIPETILYLIRRVGLS